MIVSSYSSSFSLCQGQVKDNADPAQHGRLKIFIPSVDSPDYVVADLPWALYVSPFGGTTANFKVGRENDEVPGGSSYGMWAIPKVGAQVLVGFLEGDPNVRFWMGCFYIPELNRTLPQSVGIKTELDETGVYPQQTIPHYLENLTEAGLAPGSEHYKTRGGWQRSVSHPSNKNKNKPTDNGYYPKPLEPEKSDSQIYSITTPGRHYLAMSDVAEECRVRLKTTAGTQIILDDTNERIYISTAKGRNWIELDEGSGKIYFYTASKFNVHAENDLNLYSSENINIVARKRVNIQSEERGVKVEAKMGVQLLSDANDIKLTAARAIQLITINGANSSAVGERQSSSQPPYSGEPLGVTRDYAEEAGSSDSKVLVTAHSSVELKANNGDVVATGRHGVQLRAVDNDVTIQSSTNINLKSRQLKTKIDDVGYKAGPYKVSSLKNFNGEAAVADQATALTGERVKSKMIVPEHEGWTRDEDEESSPTERNKSYQG